MILTKEEFANEYDFSARHVYRLIRDGKIKVNKDELIDIEENKDFCKKRKEDLKNKENPGQEDKTAEEQLSLEMELLSSRLDERKQKAELLQLKIAKEKGAVVETNVLNNIIRMTFDGMMKSLTEFPGIYAMEIINIVNAEENPKEILVEYLTNKVTESIKMGIDNAKQAAKKYYGKCED